MTTQREDFTPLNGKWVQVRYQIAPDTEPRNVSGRLRLPTARDAKDKAFELQLTGVSTIPIYHSMIISCVEDTDRTWPSRAYSSGNDEPWWA